MISVDRSETYVFSHIQVLDELLLIASFVPFLLLAIRFYKKGGIIILSIINVSFGILILHNDTMGVGWEFVSSYVFLVSKFNHLQSVIIDFDDWQKINVTVVWGCYILLVGYSCVFVGKIREWLSAKNRRKMVYHIIRCWLGSHAKMRQTSDSVKDDK